MYNVALLEYLKETRGQGGQRMDLWPVVVRQIEMALAPVLGPEWIYDMRQETSIYWLVFDWKDGL